MGHSSLYLKKTHHLSVSHSYLAGFVGIITLVPGRLGVCCEVCCEWHDMVSAVCVEGTLPIQPF